MPGDIFAVAFDAVDPAYFLAFRDFQGLKTEINIVIISTVTCIMPKIKFIFSLYR